MLTSLAITALQHLRNNRLSPLKTFLIQSRSLKNIDRSKVPVLDENDLEEHFVSGSGPGGQSVNKSVNCCFLKHKPTGLFVKVHYNRNLEHNRKAARELLVCKLDNFYNGEDSVENQKKRVVLHRLTVKAAESERRLAMKREHKNSILGKSRSPSSSKTNSPTTAHYDDVAG